MPLPPSILNAIKLSRKKEDGYNEKPIIGEEEILELIHKSNLPNKHAYIAVGSSAITLYHGQLAKGLTRTLDVDLAYSGNTEDIREISGELREKSKDGLYLDILSKEFSNDLPPQWEGRSKNTTINGIKIKCPSPEDICLVKLEVGRDKDILFTAELLKNKLVSLEKMVEIIIQPDTMKQIRNGFYRDMWKGNLQACSTICAIHKAKDIKTKIKKANTLVDFLEQTTMHSTHKTDIYKLVGREMNHRHGYKWFKQKAKQVDTSKDLAL